MDELDLFAATAAWKTLSSFFESPTAEKHVNQTARELKISSSAASTALRQLHQEGFLRRKKLGNAVFYSLDAENTLAKRLKSAWLLSKLLRQRDWKNDEFISVALYGSGASGEFVEKSDVDLLVITSIPAREAEKKFDNLKKNLKKQLSITAMPLSQWSALARKNDRFYKETIANHVLLHGSSIVL